MAFYSRVSRRPPHELWGQWSLLLWSDPEWFPLPLWISLSLSNDFSTMIHKSPSCWFLLSSSKFLSYYACVYKNNFPNLDLFLPLDLSYNVPYFKKSDFQIWSLSNFKMVKSNGFRWKAVQVMFHFIFSSFTAQKNEPCIAEWARTNKIIPVRTLWNQ